MAIREPFAVVPVPLGTIATGNALASRPASHLGEFKYAGMVWESSGNTNLWVRGDFGSAMEIDFVGMLGANALPGTTIRFRLGDSQADVDGAAQFDSGILPFIDPATTDQQGLYHSHFELSAAETRRWWRIDIAGHAGNFEASMLIMGAKVEFADFYNPDFEFGVVDRGEIDWGRFGVPEEANGVIWRSLTMNFGWMTDSDRFAKFQPLVKQLGKRGVALWCFDPEPTEQRQSKTYFGWLTEPPFAKPSLVTQERYTMAFNIVSMF